jgi:hypothetical protein
LRTLWLGLFTAAECEIMPANNAVHDLLALAQEPSSEKRRELLHAVTDLFLSTDQHEAATTEMFGSVMGSVCDGVSEEDRADLAVRLAPVTFAPHGLVSKLAHDDSLRVASPVLEQSPVLTDTDLLSVATSKGDEHMVAVASRPTLNTQVTDALVERGSQTVLRRVSANEGASFSVRGANRLADRAADDTQLQDNLARRSDLPPEVQKTVRAQVDERKAFGQRGRNSRTAPVDGPMRSLLNGIKSEFSALSGLEPDRIEDMVLNERIDLLVIICRSLNLNENVFERLVRFRVQHTGGVLPGMDGLLSQFRTLPPQAAQRMARFLKVRASASS